MSHTHTLSDIKQKFAYMMRLVYRNSVAASYLQPLLLWVVFCTLKMVAIVKAAIINFVYIIMRDSMIMCNVKGAAGNNEPTSYH